MTEAKNAIMSIINGAQIDSVITRLEEKKKELNKAEEKLWKSEEEMKEEKIMKEEEDPFKDYE